MKKILKPNMYVEKCRAVMYDHNLIPNISFIVKKFEKGKNHKPYKKAIEYLLKSGEWIKEGNVFKANQNIPHNRFGKEIVKKMPELKDIALNSKGILDALDPIVQEVRNNPDKYVPFIPDLIEHVIDLWLRLESYKEVKSKIEEILKKKNPKTYKSIK